MSDILIPVFFLVVIAGVLGLFMTPKRRQIVGLMAVVLLWLIAYMRNHIADADPTYEIRGTVIIISIAAMYCVIALDYFIRFRAGKPLFVIEEFEEMKKQKKRKN